MTNFPDLPAMPNIFRQDPTSHLSLSHCVLSALLLVLLQQKYSVLFYHMYRQFYKCIILIIPKRRHCLIPHHLFCSLYHPAHTYVFSFKNTQITMCLPSETCPKVLNAIMFLAKSFWTA